MMIVGNVGNVGNGGNGKSCLAREVAARTGVPLVDGNYGGTRDVRLTLADVVVLLDYPRFTCAAGARRARPSTLD